MIKTNCTIPQIRKCCLIVFVLLAAVPFLSGCSSHRHSSETTSETRTVHPRSDVRYRMIPEQTQVETTTIKREDGETTRRRVIYENR